MKLPIDFSSWISRVKTEIRTTQIKASIRVNTELIQLYWLLGNEIVEAQKQYKWGDNFIQQMSDELRVEFPNMTGFSFRNLMYIKKWYLFYSQDVIILQQLVAKIEYLKLQQPVAKLETLKVKQAVSQLEPPILKQPVSQLDDPKWQQVVAKLGEVFFSVLWGHHLYIVSKCKSVDEAIFYLQQTVENNWSRSILLNFLDTHLYDRQGKAITNFDKTIPSPQGELAQQILRDPYCIDFLCLRKDFQEKDFEKALLDNITRFLLELGQGFAFVGRQMPLDIEDDTLYADLLFYQIPLRRYVVVKLKIGVFKPEYIGQLSTYVVAVNHQYQSQENAPTIGLLICKDKNNTMVRYALEGSTQPLGVSSYDLEQALPKEIQDTLPSIEDIENSLNKVL